MRKNAVLFSPLSSSFLKDISHRAGARGKAKSIFLQYEPLTYLTKISVCPLKSYDY
jgi:hypothetical protein